MKILFIGCGNMGQAILQGLQTQKLPNIEISAISPNKHKEIAQKFSITTFANTAKAVINNNYDYIILAVKPHQYKSVLAELKKHKNNSVIISVIAGITIQSIKNNLPNNQYKVVRVMPNTPATIGQGVFGCYCDEKIEKNEVNKLFNSLGQVFWLENEDQINAITAISGSGPAYIFHLMDCMNKMAQEIGLNQNISQKIVEQTLLGSVELVKSNNISLETLRKNVTSPGGTTEAGLTQLIGNDDNLLLLIKKTILAAYNKAEILGKNDD